ncbi:MAG: helix-turn-helix domain-containing protein [Clostridia bacterium]|nr:helix-turn-helix domain-containing protein [Clostridia bacterium]
MRKTVVNRFRDFVDFNVIQYGHEDCRPNYTIGDFVRSNYLIHYVHRGKGTYRAFGKTHTVSAGSAFLIYPGSVTRYVADSDDPWEYSWVEFTAADAEKFLSSTPFSQERPVALSPSAEEPFLRLVESDPLNPYSLYAALMCVLSAFSSKRPRQESKSDEYVKYALNYIHTIRYHSDMSVQAISDYVGVNRSYLCRLFREKLGVSPKQYITSFRLKTAARLLEETNLTITQVAASSGFSDPLHFSSAFRAAYNQSPTQYRAAHKAE